MAEELDFVGMPNAEFADSMRKFTSGEYKRRIPKATQGSISDTLKALQRFRPHMNEFVDVLVNRIGLEIYGNNVFNNPLKELKRNSMEWGDTIEEIQVGLLTAHTYNPDVDSTEKDIFGTETPDVDVSFHTINRQNMYKVTVNDTLLRRAFLADNGLTTFTSQLMAAPTSSDEWDEFLITTRLIVEYEANNGFHKVQVPDVGAPTSDAADAKALLRTARELADEFPFISTKYNAAGMPVSASRDSLIFITTASVKAAMDVEALAMLFNLDKAEMYGRIIVLPKEHIPIKGFQGIITTKDFFVMADTTLETTSIFNPHKLQYNYFLHHHGIYSASRFVNAVLLTSEPVAPVVIAPDPVTAVQAVTVVDGDGATATTLERGTLYQADSWGVTASGFKGAVRWSVEGNTTFLTHITAEGVLHVSGIEGATELTIRATSVYVNPGDPQAVSLTQIKKLPVSGDTDATWPVPPAEVGE